MPHLFARLGDEMSSGDSDDLSSGRRLGSLRGMLSEGLIRRCEKAG